MTNGIVTYFQKVKTFHREAKLFLITAFIFFLLNGGYQVVFNLYLNAMGYGSDFIGGVASLRLIVGAILGIPLGVIATRYGYKKILIAIGVIAIFSIIGLANTHILVEKFSLTQAISENLIRFFSVFWGLAFSLFGIINAPFLASYSDDHDRDYLFGFKASLQTWAMMLGSFLGGTLAQSFKFMLDSLQAYQITLNIFSLIAFTSIIPIFFLRTDQGSNQGSFIEVLKTVGNTTRHSNVRRLLMYSILIGTGAGLIIPLFNIFLHERLQATDFQIGTLISLTQIATSLGCLLTPYLIRTFGQTRSVVASQILSIPFLLIVGGVPFFPVVCVAYFFRTTLMNMVNPIVDSVSMKVVSEEERAATSSLIRTIRSFGRGVGVYLSGVIMADGNYLLPYILTCCFYLSGSLILHFSFNKKQTNSQPSLNIAK